MKPSREFPDLCFMGTTVNFYLPARKLDSPLVAKGGQTAAKLMESFFIEQFGGFTHEVSNIRGYWVGRQGETITDKHERYEVTIHGKSKAAELFRFLAGICALLEEDSIYLTYDGRTWLVKPAAKGS